MKRKLPLVLIPVAVLLAVLLLSQNDAPVAGTAALTSQGGPVGASGMRLYVDPDTGEFIEAPSEGVQVEMAQEGMASFSTSQSGLFEEDAPGGGKMVNLQGRFQQAFTATIGESGVVVLDCGHVHHVEAGDSDSEKEGE